MKYLLALIITVMFIDAKIENYKLYRMIANIPSPNSYVCGRDGRI